MNSVPYGERAFSFFTRIVWNSLPDLLEIQHLFHLLNLPSKHSCFRNFIFDLFYFITPGSERVKLMLNILVPFVTIWSVFTVIFINMRTVELKMHHTRSFLCYNFTLLSIMSQTCRYISEGLKGHVPVL